MMQETSLQAWEKTREDLGKNQWLVYCMIEQLGYATNSMIADILHWSINRVTPRTNELRKLNKVVYSHTSWCPITKSKAMYWKIA